MWVYLARQTSVKARRLIIHSLIAAWVMTVAGGLAANVAPDLSWSTPLSFVLPGVIADDESVRDLLEPRLADIQIFHPDIRLNRPAAPCAYTNAWGSSLALLTLFLLAHGYVAAALYVGFFMLASSGPEAGIRDGTGPRWRWESGCSRSRSTAICRPSCS